MFASYNSKTMKDFEMEFGWVVENCKAINLISLVVR